MAAAGAAAGEAVVAPAVEEVRGAEAAHRVEGVRKAAVRPVEAGGTVAASLAGVEVAVDQAEPEAVAVGLVAAREGAEVNWQEAVGIDRPRVPHKGISPRIGLLAEIDQAQEIGLDPTIDPVPAIDPERESAIKPGSIAPVPESAIDLEPIAPERESAIKPGSIAPEPESAINPESIAPEPESAIDPESIAPEPESAINPESIAPEPESAINPESTDDPELESAINLESTDLEPGSAIDPESTIDPVLAMDRIIGRTSTTTGITATGTGTGRKGVEVGTSILGRPGGSRQRLLASHLGVLARSFTTRATARMPIHTTRRTRQSRPIR